MLSVEMLGSHLVFWLCSAGPAPDSEPELGEEEMIGEESDSDSGNDAAEQRAQLSISRPQVQQQKRQRLMPRDSSLQHLKGTLAHASQEAAGVETARHRGHHLESSAADQETLEHTRADADTAEIKSERKREHEHEHGEGHKAAAPLGRKQMRGKRKKPASQLQRVQAEVQAKKASALLSLS